MNRLYSKITITSAESGDITTLNFTNEISISSSWKQFVDKCEVTIPKKITKGGQNIVVGLSSLFRRGDKIKIELGYFPLLETYFEGYISSVSMDAPIKLFCENESFLLKQNTTTKSYRSVTLKNLLSDVLPSGIEFEAVDAELGQFRLSNVTALQVLEELQKVYSLEGFFRNRILYCGLAYVPKNSRVFNITKERNIIDNSLSWQNEDDIKIKLKAISMLPNNSKIEIEVGDVNGEQRTAHYFNLSESELKASAERDIVKYRYTGFRGSFQTFGNKNIEHGDIINLRSYKLPEQNGAYFVDGVETTFGMSGFRQNVTLGRKAISGADFSINELQNF